MNLKNKVVIVTGAGSGIGAAVAEQFAREGASVVAVGRRQEPLVATAERCAAAGRRALPLAADVTDHDHAHRIVQTTIDKYGKLDVLVNNAGITRLASICEGDILEAYDKVMNTNVRAVLRLITLATPHLKVTRGSIINISSAASSTVALGPALMTYSVSKAALDHLTRCAAAELAPHGVRVNCVKPGPVETDFLVNGNLPYEWEDVKCQTAFNRVGEPQEIADVVVFLASDKARSTTGASYVADNGYLLKLK